MEIQCESPCQALAIKEKLHQAGNSLKPFFWKLYWTPKYHEEPTDILFIVKGGYSALSGDFSISVQKPEYSTKSRRGLLLLSGSLACLSTKVTTAGE